MSLLRKLIFLLLVSTCVAQTHTYPALDTNNVFTGTNKFLTVNGVQNAALTTGGDIGAQVNNAQTACSGGNTCTVSIPSGSYTQTTPMTLLKGVILSCASRVSGDTSTLINYTGSGDAVDIPPLPNGYGVQIQNCGWVLGSSAVYGLNNQGYSTIIQNTTFAVGGNSTTMIHNKGNKNVYQNIQFINFPGNGFVCDNSIDTTLTNISAYGTNNTTGASLILDTACNSTEIDNFGGGGSNKHGFVMQNTLGGNPPAQVFVRTLITDCSSDDGWLFDSTLGAGTTQATFVDSWSAASGENCSNNNTINAHKAGVHISGGWGINFIGGKYRDNTGSGFLIDNANAQAISIMGAQILSNNLNNDGTESGVDITAAVTGVSIVGNTCTNAIDFRGHQNYCVNASSASSNVVSVIGNISYTNSVGNYLFNAGTVFGEGFPLKMQIPSGVIGIYTYPKSDADISEYSALGFNAAQSSLNWDITKGGIGYFKNGLQIGNATAGVPGLATFYGSTSGSVAVVAQAVAGTPTITWGTNSGTPAVTATAPLAINSTTGNITISVSTATSGKAMCWKTATQLGSCSTQPDSTGSCTCN